MVNRIEGQVSTSVEFTYPFSLTAFNKALNMSVGLQVLLSFVILFRFARFLTGLQTSCVGQFGFMTEFKKLEFPFCPNFLCFSEKSANAPKHLRRVSGNVLSTQGGSAALWCTIWALSLPPPPPIYPHSTVICFEMTLHGRKPTLSVLYM